MQTGAATTYRLDRLHLGVRLLTLAGWLAAWAALTALGLWAAGLLLDGVQAWLWLLWMVLALILTQWPARWWEGWLADRWPSGKTLSIAGPLWTLSDRREQWQIDLGAAPRVHLWRFEITQNRGASQRKGHVVHALRLSQGVTSIAVYCIAPPEAAAGLQASRTFFDLRQKPDPAPAAVAQQRDHLAAEADRYNRGHELSADDFMALIRQLPDQ
jgi:hypothetical protein